MKKNIFLIEKLAKFFHSFKGKLSNPSMGTLALINQFTIRKRLIFFFLLVSIGPMFLIGLISYITSRSAIDSKISKYSQKDIIQINKNLNIKLEANEDISKQFIANSQYNTALQEYSDAQDNTDVFLKGKVVSDLLQSITSTQNDISLILFMSLKDATRYQSSGITTSNDVIQRLSKSKFYHQVLQARGKAVWSVFRVDKNNTMIAMGRVINNLNLGEPVGVLFMLMKEDIISDTINNLEDSEIEQNNNEFTMIIDHSGLVMVSPFKEDINRNIAQLLGNPSKIRSLLTGKKDNDTFLVRLKKWNVRVIGKKMDDRSWYILNVARTSYLYSESNWVGLITLFLGVLFGIVAIVISIAIAFGISNPLNKVIYAMQQAEKGDFTIRSNIKRHDELGLLGKSFDHMIDQIGTLLKETQKAIEAVSEHSTVLDESSDQSVKAAESVAAAMEEISKGTMEQTSEAEKSSTAMNDLASQIDVVVSKASEVETISGSTRELSLKSQDAVDQLIQKTFETDQITETIIQNIIDLHSSADRIRQITEVITGIAEQTNLLGLNASIEAARAGEMGQGFAVVSEEINKLALQSRDAAKTINNILQEIQTKTENSAKTAEEAHKILEEQRSAVNLAQEAFTQITTSTGDIIARIIFMNHLINNINHSKEHTIQSIMNISSISEETAASAEEVSSSSEEQTALADQVRMLAQESRNKAEELAVIIRKFQV